MAASACAFEFLEKQPSSAPSQTNANLLVVVEEWKFLKGVKGINSIG